MAQAAPPRARSSSLAPGKVVLISGGYDHTIRFWEVQTGICFRTLQYPDSPINCLRVSPDKKYLAVGGNPHARLYTNDNTSTGHIHQFDGHTQNITQVVFDRNSTGLFTSCEDTTAKGWDIRSNQPTSSFPCHAAVNSVARHPAEPLLVTGDQSGRVKIWDLRTRKCMKEMMPESEVAVRSVTFSPNAQMLFAANNVGNCYVWRVGLQRKIVEEAGIPSAEALAFVEQASTIVSICNSDSDDRNGSHSESSGEPKDSSTEEEDDGKAESASSQVVEPPPPRETREILELGVEEVYRLHAHKAYILRCLVSPDSRYLATCSADHTVKLWSLPTFQPAQTLSGHQRWVWDMEFSADSNFLVTGSSDNSARSWNVDQGDTICVFNGHHKAVISVTLITG